MRTIRLIGQVRANNTYVGYVVLDTETNHAVPKTVNEIIMMVRNGFTLVNAEVISNELVGTEGSLSRLPIFSASGQLESSPTITILGIVEYNGKDTDYYSVMDVYGKKAVKSSADLIRMMQVYKAVNAKLVQKGDKYIISAIRGTFDRVPSNTLGTSAKSSSNNVKSDTPKVSIASQYRVRQCIPSIMAKTMKGRLNFKPWARGRSLIDEIDSVDAIKGRIATVYRGVSVLDAYLLSTSVHNVILGDVFKSHRNAIDRYYDAVVVKKIDSSKDKVEKLQKQIDWLREGATFIDAVVARKEAGEYLNNREFRCYYKYKHSPIKSDNKAKQYLASIDKQVKRLESFVPKKKEQVRITERCIGRPKEVLYSMDLPFFNTYIRTGKLNYTMEVLKNTQILNSFETKKSLMLELDALFILALIKSKVVLSAKDVNTVSGSYGRRNLLITQQAIKALPVELQNKYNDAFKSVLG